MSVSAWVLLDVSECMIITFSIRHSLIFASEKSCEGDYLCHFGWRFQKQEQILEEKFIFTELESKDLDELCYSKTSPF
jgi:hypothetical protein